MSLQLPLRTRNLLDQAQDLEKQSYFIQAMLSYSCFIEQALLAAYILRLRKNDPRQAKQKIDEIIKLKDSGKLTFGMVLNTVEPTFDASTIEFCRKIKKIRDALVAHPFFIMPLDPTNKYKLAFYDVNNYRKIIRRLYRLLEDESSLAKEESKRIQDFLKRGSPLVRMRALEVDAFNTENIILKALCEWMGEKVRHAYQMLSQIVNIIV